MKDKELQIVPLTEDDKQWLMNVYSLRRKELSFGRVLISLLAWLVLVMPFWFIICFLHDIFLGNYAVWLTPDWFTDRLLMRILLGITGAAIEITTIYKFWVLPFKEDAVSGVKEKVPFTVVTKKYYEHTGQYFVYLGEDKRKGHEVTKEIFNTCEEGGIIIFERGIKSGHIISEFSHAVVKSTIKRPGQFDWTGQQPY